MAKSATSAGNTATLRATALRVAATAVATAAAVGRPATRAEDTGTWRETARRVKSATTVSSPSLVRCRTEESYQMNPGGELGHVSRDCPTEASGERVCYKCKQPGHVQVACPN